MSCGELVEEVVRQCRASGRVVVLKPCFWALWPLASGRVVERGEESERGKRYTTNTLEEERPDVRGISIEGYSEAATV